MTLSLVAAEELFAQGGFADSCSEKFWKNLAGGRANWRTGRTTYNSGPPRPC